MTEKLFHCRLTSVLDCQLLFNTGTGKSGKSIWGKKFADELSPSLRVSLGVDTLYTYANKVNSNE